MTEWEPIESAPKDGTNILLTDGVTVSQGGWQDAAAQGLDASEAYLCSEGFWSVDCIEQPTHWMPLPDPPLASSGGRAT